MSVADVFNAARALKRSITGEGLTQHEVDLLNALIGQWKAPAAPVSAPVNPTALADEAAFFASLRPALGPLKQDQVDGIQTLLQAFGEAVWPVSWAAYGLATAWRETNKTMQPVREAYWCTEEWRKNNLTKYYPAYGRGYVQLTWVKNYERADTELGLNGTLAANLDLALQPSIAAKVMVRGMVAGWFTGTSLVSYLPAHGPATEQQFALARHIINGTDHASEIAMNALVFQEALTAGGWA